MGDSLILVNKNVKIKMTIYHVHGHDQVVVRFTSTYNIAM